MNLILKEENVEDNNVEIDDIYLHDFETFKQIIISKINTNTDVQKISFYINENLIKEDSDLGLLKNNCEIKIVREDNNFGLDSNSISNFLGSKQNMESIFSIMQNPNMQKILSNPDLLNSLISFQSKSNDNISDLTSVIDTDEIKNLIQDTSLMNDMFQINSTLEPNFSYNLKKKESFLEENEKKEDEEKNDLEKYEQQIKKFKNMGLNDNKRCLYFLKKNEGDFNKAMMDMFDESQLFMK